MREASIERYLARIGCSGVINVSADTLSQLQENHLQSVPYENLDIVRGVPLSLEISDLYDKIVVRRRGGYCFELNALFAWLLREIGYVVTSHFARFWRDELDLPPKRRHHVLRVQAQDGLYLCDVGVGGVIARRPLRMVDGLEQMQGDESYRLDRDPDWGWMLSERYHGTWRPLYSFTEELQHPKDFVMATYWCEHAPDSIFTKGAMVSLLTPDGRTTVAGEEFRLFSPTGVQSFTPTSPQAYREALYTYFGLALD